MTARTIASAILDSRGELSERAQAHIAKTRPKLARTYRLIEEGFDYETVEADSIEEALAQARENVDRNAYCTDDGTVWVDIAAVHCLSGDREQDTVRIDPPEPDCEEGREHQWASPHDILGGLKDNPGVSGNGGGVIVREVCMHCGCERITNTWAQRRDTGEQGLTSVGYEVDKHDLHEHLTNGYRDWWTAEIIESGDGPGEDDTWEVAIIETPAPYVHTGIRVTETRDGVLHMRLEWHLDEADARRYAEVEINAFKET